MNFNELTDRLIVQIKTNLPGNKAQELMAPKGRLPLDLVYDSNHTKKSAVLILIHPNDDSAYVTVIKRTVDGRTHSGQMALPGGKYEKGDKTLIQTALREAEEEIGIKKEDVEILGSLTHLFIPVSNFDVQPIIGRIHYKPNFIKNLSEVEEIYSIKLNDLLHAEIVTKTFHVRNQTISAPFYILNDIEIWGATAMILSEFIAVLNSIK